MTHLSVVPFTDPPAQPEIDMLGWLVLSTGALVVACVIAYTVILAQAFRRTTPENINRVFKALAVTAVSLLPLVGAVTLRDHLNDSRREAYHEAVDEQTTTAKAALEDYYGVELTGFLYLPRDEAAVPEVEVTTADGATTDCLLHVLPDPTTDTGYRLAISCGGTDLDSATELPPAP